MPVAVASGDVPVTGAATGRVYIQAAAPQITPAPWVIEPGENFATIITFPEAPVEPDWSVSSLEGFISIADFPRYPVQSVPVFAVSVSGSAQGRTIWSIRRVTDVNQSENGGKLVFSWGL